MSIKLAEGINLYREGASHALAGYQLIESLLKTYISNHFKIVKFILGNQLYFGFTGNEYEQAPLERLVNIFSKLCNDDQLIRELRNEITHRNHIAHQSMLIMYSKRKLGVEQFISLNDEMVKRNNTIANLLDRLHIAHENLILPFNKNIPDTEA